MSAATRIFIATDITNDDDIAALVKATVEKTGRLDFLVNVACTYLDNGAEHDAHRLAEGARRSTLSAPSC